MFLLELLNHFQSQKWIPRGKHWIRVFPATAWLQLLPFAGALWASRDHHWPPEKDNKKINIISGKEITYLHDHDWGPWKQSGLFLFLVFPLIHQQSTPPWEITNKPQQRMKQILCFEGANTTPPSQMLKQYWHKLMWERKPKKKEDQ